jgi:predicted dehydrogenase
MGNEKVIAGFIGAGGIARSHAFALNSLKYYYNDAPDVELAAVCSATEQSRKLFAERYGFTKSCILNDFIADDKIDTVFILGPNKVHYEHFRAALGMKAIKRIYLEKPVCSNPSEEASIRKLTRSNPGVRIQVGFQYLFTSAVREALLLWKSGKLGKPVHFDLKYYHSDYLKKEYRDRRVSRLTPAPDGGAMADLGCHAISLLIAFLGDNLRITSALQAGNFDDVCDESDLFSQISILDEDSRAAGTLSSSRISSGTGDNLSLEIYAEKGAIRYSSVTPDFFEYYTEDSGLWARQMTGSNYKPYSSFPSGHVPAGWHRSMIHAHYVFLTEGSSEVIIPDIEHGLQVQRLVRETAEHLEKFRERNYN